MAISFFHFFFFSFFSFFNPRKWAQTRINILPGAQEKRITKLCGKTPGFQSDFFNFADMQIAAGPPESLRPRYVHFSRIWFITWKRNLKQS